MVKRHAIFSFDNFYYCAFDLKFHEGEYCQMKFNAKSSCLKMYFFYILSIYYNISTFFVAISSNFKVFTILHNHTLKYIIHLSLSS